MCAALYRSLFWGVLNLCFIGNLFPQTAVEYWFAAPDVSDVSGESPVLLVIGSAGESSDVIIDFPSNPAFVPLTYDLAPSEMEIIDLTPYLNSLENKPPDFILKKGLHITATKTITAYYRVAAPNHSADYNLRGNQALGKEFFIPGQTQFTNVQGNSFFDIVATQNQTTVQITPSSHIQNHVPGVPFSVVLNRGETFSCRESGSNLAGNLVGSYIQADQPIAVTVSDDALSAGVGSGNDLCGDQIIPVKSLGTEYIVLKGEAAVERIYITATEDQTGVNIQGKNPLNLNRGQTGVVELTLNATAITSSLPVYVWHQSGVAGEPGGAIIPPITCTGTRVVKFVRPASDNFFFYLLTQTGNEAHFRLNGTSNILPSAFSPVPGTNGQWMAGRIEALGSLVTSTNQIDNTSGVFHMGMINFDENKQASYAYFSNYNPLALGEKRVLCKGDSLVLDAGEENSYFLWNTGATTRQITVKQPGKYWVDAQFEGCPLSDTIQVEEISPEVNLGSDTTICPGESLSFTLNFPGATYRWNDTMTAAFRTITAAGIYWVTVNQQGCQASDTLTVQVQPLPVLNLGPDLTLCSGQTATLNAATAFATYLWQDGSTAAQMFISEAGNYSVERRLAGCRQRDTVTVKFSALTVPEGVDTTLCEGDSLRLDVSVEGADYLWEDGSVEPIRIVTEPGRYFVLISDDCETAQTDFFIGVRDCECFVFVPNVFTPNGDGINDDFRPRVICPLERYALVIVDRWGKKVFESQSPQDYWTGSSGNRQAAEGVYYWAIQFLRSGERATQVTRGYVVLMR
ncbi:MAG: gliding motility-associated C-terminal domain-containing protein [Bacteroidia bacterium]|nr:gliding motility-associated C-terminal domain-containing protein [Bacteroidia bacterium]